MTGVKALVITGYGLNCDYETDFSLKVAGAEPHMVHVNELIRGVAGAGESGNGTSLEDYHIIVLGGGFSWADDHGAGVLMASKLNRHLGERIHEFIHSGKLIIGICNGFQALVNMGLVPALRGDYTERRVAITYNDSGNFIDSWVNLRVNPDSPCIFTKGIETIELPVRHGEGKFFARENDAETLFSNNQVVMQYADHNGDRAGGRWPLNPNGSVQDVAGICDPSGRVFGLMPHPEAFNHFTNHPSWTEKKEALTRSGIGEVPAEGDGIKIFRNAVEYILDTFSV